MTGMTTTRVTRADRMALPLARDVLRDLAVENGACIRPIQLRRTDRDTGQTQTVLVPCGSTLDSVCPPCAERAKTLRAAQCREGWHLEDEPGLAPGPATQDQQWWSRCAPRPSATVTRPRRPGRTRATLTSSSPSWTARSPRRASAGRPPRPGRSAAPLDPPPPGRPGPAQAQGQPPHGRPDLHRPGRQDLPPVPVRHADLPVLRPGRRERDTRRPADLRLWPRRPGRAGLRGAV
jgi:hypothetical protein